MTEKIEEFIRRIHQEHLDSLTLEEIREIRDRLSPEERLRGLGPEELRHLKDYLKTLH